MPARTPRRRPVEPSFPLIPAIIVVILAGFGIGGAISYFTNREPEKAAVPAASPTPILAVASPPHALVPSIATPRPHRSAAAPSAAPPAVTASPTPSRAPSPTAAPSALAPSSPPSSEPSSRAPAAGGATARPLPSPHRAATPRASPPASGSPAAPGEEIDSSFGRDAGALVRRYIAALMAGDEATAAGALGEDASSRGLHMAEEEFIDRSTRITGLRTHTSGDTVMVETDIEGARGTYFERFLVAHGANGLVIREHDFIKP